MLRTAAPLVQRGDSMAKPCRGDWRHSAVWMIPATGCECRQPCALNPSVGLRRQLPLHKGGPVAGRPYCLWSGVRTAILSLPFCIEPAQRGSAVWVQRHAGGSAVWPWRLATVTLAAAQYGSPDTGPEPFYRFPGSPGWWDFPGRADPAGPGRTSRKYPKTRSCLPETAPPPLRWPH